MRECRILRMKCKRDKRLKPTRLILHGPQLHQMVHAVFIVLHMSI